MPRLFSRRFLRAVLVPVAALTILAAGSIPASAATTTTSTTTTTTTTVKPLSMKAG